MAKPLSRYKKVTLKVIRDGEITWVHLCSISRSLFYEFHETTGCDRSEFGAFLSVWCKRDFHRDMSFARYEDVQELRKLVNEKYHKEYPELYYLTDEENPRVSGWFRLWLSQHMRVEIVSRLAENEIDRVRKEEENV